MKSCRIQVDRGEIKINWRSPITYEYPSRVNTHFRVVAPDGYLTDRVCKVFDPFGMTPCPGSDGHLCTKSFGRTPVPMQLILSSLLSSSESPILLCDNSLMFKSIAFCYSLCSHTPSVHIFSVYTVRCLSKKVNLFW